MNFKRSKEWYYEMAAIEADYDVCAGRQIFPMSEVPKPPVAKPKKTRKPKVEKATVASRSTRRRSAAAESSGS